MELGGSIRRKQTEASPVRATWRAGCLAGITRLAGGVGKPGRDHNLARLHLAGTPRCARRLWGTPWGDTGTNACQ
eukprot:2390937-Alexandrium_andersonii.AAC.1